jgi:hypothetical protein
MARCPRGLSRSRCAKQGGTSVSFGITKFDHAMYIFAETCDCSHCCKIRGFAHTHSREFSTHFRHAPPCRLSRVLGASESAPRSWHPAQLHARHPVDKRSHGAQKPTRSPGFVRDRKTKLPPAPNGDSRLADDAAIVSRSSEGARHLVFRLPQNVVSRDAMSDHVPSYARHDAGRSPPPRARPPPRGLAARGRPRARPIGRSVRRPRGSRPRRSARSRSEARGEPTRRSRSR